MGFKPRYRRVTVHWDDASTSDPWQPPDETSLAPVSYLKVASTICRDDQAQVSNVTVIPRGMIRRVERL